MTVTSPNPTSAAAAASAAAASKSSTNSNTTISENQFLTLLTEQLENQDPLQPEDDTQFLAQMAQFTTLQETDTFTSQMQQLSAATYMGATVTMSSNGSQVTGQVTGVDTSGTTPNLIINGQEYPLTSLQLIQSSAVSSAANAASSAAATTPGSSASTST